MTLVAHAATVVGLVSGVLALVFLVLPELQPQASEPERPPARNFARLKELVVRPDVTRAEYLALADLPRSGFTPDQLARRGVFVLLRVSIDDFKGVPLTLRRELFDARSGRELRQESAITITPPTSKLERDWPDFVPLPERPGRFSVVVKLLASGEQAPLATFKTKPLPGASAG